MLQHCVLVKRPILPLKSLYPLWEKCLNCVGASNNAFQSICFLLLLHLEKLALCLQVAYLNTVIPQHPPEVIHSVGQWTLGCNVGDIVTSALCGRVHSE